MLVSTDQGWASAVIQEQRERTVKVQPSSLCCTSTIAWPRLAKEESAAAITLPMGCSTRALFTFRVFTPIDRGICRLICQPWKPLSGLLDTGFGGAASHRACKCQPLSGISFLLHLLDLSRFGADSSLSFNGEADFRLSKDVGDVARVFPASLLAGALQSQQPRFRTLVYSTRCAKRLSELALHPTTKTT